MSVASRTHPGFVPDSGYVINTMEGCRSAHGHLAQPHLKYCYLFHPVRFKLRGVERRSVLRLSSSQSYHGSPAVGELRPAGSLVTACYAEAVAGTVTR